MEAHDHCIRVKNQRNLKFKTKKQECKYFTNEIYPLRLLAFNLTAQHQVCENVLYIRFSIQYIYEDSRCLLAFEARNVEWVGTCNSLLPEEVRTS